MSVTLDNDIAVTDKACLPTDDRQACLGAKQSPEGREDLPLCPVFGVCGGCLSQDIPYSRELKEKEERLKNCLRQHLDIDDGLFEPIIASPRPYHYRNRLDLKFARTRDRGILMGFTPKSGRGIVPVEGCPIADKSISDFIRELKKQAVSRLPPAYRQANLVVRTGDDGRVLWGGIGRRSCRVAAADYLWTEIRGKKIFYSLDTFFQANLSILPRLFQRMEALELWSPQTSLYDLYAGVGLFGVTLAGDVGSVVLVEECPSSVQLARYNAVYHQWQNLKIVEGRVEDILPALLQQDHQTEKIAIIDPPRAGLSPAALRTITAAREFRRILYLSCNTETLGRDLAGFVREEWQIKKIIPFDFFPRTRHVETLVLLAKLPFPPPLF
jgi:tRNA/tmRNA/rRNA uracil-C5-methylase (TrmA/RlmC/RlmD family)